MYGYPPWAGPPPQSGVIYVPSPQQGPPPDPLSTIVQWKNSLEQLEKAFKKEEKKEEKKHKGGDANVINMMFLMILLSPITGPVMSHFFKWGLSMLPH
jgi:hypothetical protein